ncbi:putative nuclease HARBI1 [Anabrus simplex]
MLKRRFIYFPRREQHPQIAARFSELSRSNFPGIIGAIDCTHIPIVAPSHQEAQRYYNRKHFYSVNCQVVCDADMHITNIVARWPGSTHDSRIFRNSVIHNELEQGRYDGHLIGDSGYACKKYLLTPVLQERNAAERRYNIAHRQARNVVERVFGIWKRRFPCLQYTLRTKIPTTQLVIIATSILHNYAIRRGEPEFEDEEIPNENENHVGLPDERDNMTGVNWRNQIINMHFA